MRTEKRDLQENEEVLSFEYGDPSYVIKDLDKYLRRYGLELVEIDTGSSDWYIKIEKIE